jgi:hypothetical protein
VDKLLQKCLSKKTVMGEVDNMTFVGILSFQLLLRQFVEDFDRRMVEPVASTKIFEQGGTR